MQTGSARLAPMMLMVSGHSLLESAARNKLHDGMVWYGMVWYVDEYYSILQRTVEDFALHSSYRSILRH